MPPIVDRGCVFGPISSAATGYIELEGAVAVHDAADDRRSTKAITEVVQEFERSGHDQRA